PSHEISRTLRAGIVAAHGGHASPRRLETTPDFPCGNSGIDRIERGFFRSTARARARFSSERKAACPFVAGSDPAGLFQGRRGIDPDVEAGPPPSVDAAGDRADVGLARIESQPRARGHT